MASEAEISEISSLFERMIRNRDMSLFLPFMLSLSQSSSSRNNTDPDHDSDSDATEDSRIILVNPFTQGMVVIDGASSLEELLNNLGNATKTGQPPASKESIEAMEKVEIEEGDGGECVVCLEEFEDGGVVKEMPCKHRFHGKCIEKWLGIHGSCPVCRYQMPVDEKDDGKKREEEEGGERRRVGGGEVWVSFSINRSRRNQDQASSGDDSNDSSSNPRDDDDEVEN